jgi:hypothetical protein
MVDKIMNVILSTRVDVVIDPYISRIYIRFL